MPVHRWDELKRERLNEHRLQEIEDQVAGEVYEMNLAPVRDVLDKTQVEVGEETGAS